MTACDAAELVRNKAVASAFLRAIVEGDAATCSALLDPEGSWWVLGWGEMSAANFLISLSQTIDRSSSQSMTIIGMTAEAERVAVEASGEFNFPEGVYANRYHYLFKIRDDRIFAGFEYFDTSVAARFFAGV